MSESRSRRPEVVSSEEWLVARKALLRKEKDITRARDLVRAERLELPMVKLEQEYHFRGPDGEMTLLDLFEGRQQLVVHHFMWIDRRDEGCPSCSMLVDTLGDVAHLHAANTSLAFVSRAPIEKLEAYRKRMGWSIPLYSSFGTDFNYDFQATVDRSRGAVQYNYRDVTALGGMWAEFVGDLPGESVFFRDGDEVFHSYSAYARGTEAVSNVFAFLDLTPLGRQEESGVQGWVRHRDRYDANEIVALQRAPERRVRA
ncbi:MAG: DUF899 domain-containing protein [Gemmatimonadaceae bacterium]